MDLRGSLTEKGLYDLLQYLAQHKVTGCLIVRQYQGTKGFIFYETGKVVHIGLGSPKQKGVRQDAEALSVLVSFGQGRYQFEEKVQAPARTLTGTLDQLFLEATRLMDEAKAEGKLLLHEDHVFAARKAEHSSSVSLSFAALQLLGYLNSTDSLREIAHRKNLHLKAVLEAAEELFKHKLVAFSQESVDPRFLEELKQVLTELLGPVGDYLVEESLLDLNLSEKFVPKQAAKDLLKTLRKELHQDNVKQWFDGEAQKLCLKYGIAVIQKT